MGTIIVVVGIVGCGPSQPEANGRQASAPQANSESAQDRPAPPPAEVEVPASAPEADTSATSDSPTVDAADESSAPPDRREEPQADEEPEPILPEPLPAPEGAVQLNPTEEVWINREKKEVHVGGQVALRQGMLEMFACKKGTKEHESVVALNSLAATIHAALLAVGAVPGTPVSYDPEYKPSSGTEIDITVEWKDPQGAWHSANAREWVRNVHTGKELDVPWVFAGSGFYKDEETGKEHYLAESGDVICVSNFGTAMLDLPVESSQAEAGLLFEAFTERVPALGTPVRLVLRPKVDKEDES